MVSMCVSKAICGGGGVLDSTRLEKKNSPFVTRNVWMSSEPLRMGRRVHVSQAS